MIVLAIFAFSAAATISIGHAAINGSLVDSTTLTIAGSSTVYPVASEEAATFPAYWNALVTANPSWGADKITNSLGISLAGQGSGTAIPALTGGTSDIGEMSRPPKEGSSEWNTDPTLQIWAVGVDSVAICIPTTMATWFPTTLTTQEVAELFMDVPTGVTPAATVAADTGLAATHTTDYYLTNPTPYFTTWMGFLNYYYNNAIPTSVANAAAAAGITSTSAIQRAVRDPTSGTFDCFDNYFIVPNGFEAEYKVGGIQTTDSTGLTSQDMTTYTACETNQIVQSTMENGGDWIGFISAGILAGDSALTGLNIQFNTAAAPVVFSATKTWAPAVAPTVPNIKYAFSGVQGTGANGKYAAWRWLWEVTPAQIPSTGSLLETGVWIAYMRAMNPTTLPTGTTKIAASTTGTFMGDNQYIFLNPADCTGAADLNSALATHPALPGQTQSIPDGVVNGNDFFYFVDSYIAYYTSGIYNPYADITAQGTINGNSFLAFVSNYVSYYTTYNPVSS